MKIGDLYLGKTDARDDPHDLKLATYTAALPPLPAGPVGHATLIARDAWGMLGNGPDPTVSPDFAGAGDCVFAGGDHETMLWNAERGHQVAFTGANSIADYSSVTGYNPANPSTDRGTDVRNALNYRRHTGLRDATGHRHKITAYVALTAGDLTQIKQSIYLFSVAAVGIQFPTTAMDQFNAGKPWTVVRGAKIEGGHYVPIVYWDPVAGMFWAVTWGRIQLVAPSFLAHYCDEAFAPLSSENRLRGRTLERFAGAQLLADLHALAA